jgi:hypothetical protein
MREGYKTPALLTITASSSLFLGDAELESENLDKASLVSD